MGHLQSCIDLLLTTLQTQGVMDIAMFAEHNKHSMHGPAAFLL